MAIEDHCALLSKLYRDYMAEAGVFAVELKAKVNQELPAPWTWEVEVGGIEDADNVFYIVGGKDLDRESRRGWWDKLDVWIDKNFWIDCQDGIRRPRYASSPMVNARIQW